MTFGQQCGETEAHVLLSAAADAGVNFIDTAEMYPIAPARETQGDSSRVVGTWLRAPGRARCDFVVASKVAGRSVNMPWIPANRSVPRGVEAETRLDGGSIRLAAEAELSRLRTDYIDLFQLHWPDRYTTAFGQGQYQVRNGLALETVCPSLRMAKVRTCGAPTQSICTCGQQCSGAHVQHRNPKTDVARRMLHAIEPMSCIASCSKVSSASSLLPASALTYLLHAHVSAHNCLDCAQVGSERDAVSFHEQVAELGDLIREGKIRHWGVSNETTYGLLAHCAAADELGVPRPVSIQNCFNLIHRRVRLASVWQLCMRSRTRSMGSQRCDIQDVERWSVLCLRSAFALRAQQAKLSWLCCLSLGNACAKNKQSKCMTGQALSPCESVKSVQAGRDRVGGGVQPEQPQCCLLALEPTLRRCTHWQVSRF